ncbi:hypothetical protein DPMN_137975 [Dreissena polymorpha]|uniref:Uncharacterized protein n=2 Tax=Dreissena polymorpha TaxID=45954 RepID=A0A9D4JE67_DREPO|nr:hypothetical protein DPMN_137975 [Dreissena polymorpha]
MFEINPLGVVCVSHDTLCVTVGGYKEVLLLSVSTDNTIILTRVISLLGSYPVEMIWPHTICVSKDGTRMAVSGGSEGAKKLQLFKISPAMS